MSAPRFLGFNANPGRFNYALAALPFALMVAAYLYGSHVRLTDNPADKLMPSLASMWDAAYQVLFVPDKRTGHLMLLTDWLSSMQRLLLGVGAASLVGLFIGLNAGLYPGFRRLAMPFVTFISIIPPLALLPILFITFGTDELGKVVLIFLGSAWVISRDIYQHVSAIPQEQLIKGLTLGGSQTRITYGIILPQVWPKLIAAIRLNLGSAWLFLIAAEAIASQDGLGYRIFLVRRYLAMDTIIPYVFVITLTGFAMDWLLRKLSARLFPWYAATSEKDA
jgi:NitT/TauT family transport system permease protein